MERIIIILSNTICYGLLVVLWKGGRVAEGGRLLTCYPDLNRDRGFESLPFRQFSKLGFWAIVASPRQRRGSASARILKGNLKSKNNFCPLKRKFEPIFFRKSRHCSGFSCKAIISACLLVFMNLAASSNRLLLFCLKAISLSFESCQK